MGTVNEWRDVLISGALWGSLMLLWELFSRRRGKEDPAPYLTVVSWALAGLFYGLGVTFGFRVFRWPLVTIMAATIVALVFVGLIYRKKLKGSQDNSPSVAG
ncbi:MAG TPA: hypothetical protein VFF39_09795 [Verrucomicrobiae bacterium]|jgi:hypothetical protein|nr:hypothetical protein [Verrucomicrobiae bacterium]